jgi:methyltransferase
MNVLALAFAVIVGLMLAEARLSRAHTLALVRNGAVVPAGDPYVLIAVTYPLAFIAMTAEGLWRASARGDREWHLDVHAQAWFAAGLVLFIAAKALKYWAIRHLGPRWTFRVVRLPDAPLVASGPYQYVRHPNYIAVVAELAGTAMMMGARLLGPIAMAVFGAALWARIRFEDRVLRP